MSRDWTPEELAAASKAMKAAGHMSYEEFCDYLADRETHAALERFGRVQDKYPVCPRCGKMNMKFPIHTNALSRHVSIYICEACGMAEALMAYNGTPPKLRYWAIIALAEELFSTE